MAPAHACPLRPPPSRHAQVAAPLTVRVQPAAVMDAVPAMRLLAQAHYHLAPLVVEGIPMMVRGTARRASALPR